MKIRSTSDGSVKRATRAAAKTPTARAVPRRPRLRERFREETRTAILVAAEEALVQDGVHGARMEAIAKRAGIAVGTVYNYFTDREELVSALLDLRRKELIERLDSAMEAETDAPFEAQLERYVRTVLDHLESHRPLFRLLLHEEIGVASKAGSKRTMLRELVSRAERLTSVGVEQGALAPEDAPLYGAALVGILRGVSLRAIESGDGALGDTVAPLTRFFLYGSARRT